MKVQCPLCREIIEMAHFSTSEKGLRFQCPDCSKENYLPNPARVLSRVGAEVQGEEFDASKPQPRPFVSAPFPSPRLEHTADQKDEVICPKCGHAQTDREACHRCGLSFALFDSSMLPPDPRKAAELWERVLEAPDDLEIHDRFMKACNAEDRLDFAQRQYRIYERDTGRSDVVEIMRDRIRKLAQGQLCAYDLTPSPFQGGSSHRRKLLWIGVAVVGVIWLAYVVMDVISAFNT